MSSMAKSRSNTRAMFYSGYEVVSNNNQQPHFLESCFLCHKPIGPNNDIFMYRGNTPFCSDECRQEQIELDEEAEERPWRLRSLRKNDTTSNRSGSTKTVQRGSTLVVA